MIDIKGNESKILGELKDFQLATVNRCYDVFRSGQKRVLVADEVGLGKTLVAKGVIARVASLHKDEDDNLFKVVYVCSNQAIASQNIQKLYDGATIDDISETRISMQHLKILEQEHNEEILENYILLIPLTPATSFSTKGGSGITEERALMFSLLKRLECFADIVPYLETMLICDAYASWNGSRGRDFYEDRVIKCDIKCGTYINDMKAKLKEKIPVKLIREIHDHCAEIKRNGNRYIKGSYGIIGRLRQIFAEISIECFKPDLIIMDEFQRFKELIVADENTETGLLASRFLKSNNVETLLLSATPYKLYQTLEEMSESGMDEHYSEFLQVMNFLFDDEEKKDRFKEVWSNFSVALRELSSKKLTVVNVKKAAEDSMYEGVCRTERLIVDRKSSIIDDTKAKKNLKLTESDVLSYIEASRLIAELGQSFSVPSDYVKSSPYLLSFMDNYQLKRDLTRHLKKNSHEIRKARKQHLWIEKLVIQQYKELPLNNARLKALRDISFENKAEHLLWIPPSKPYYELGGAYKNNPHYSKVLVFSAWEMVPRMIATTISYEAERLTVGKLYNKEQDKTGKDYFAKIRFPVRRLKFNQEGAQPLFTLLYPSVTLSGLYDPIRYMDKSIKEIKRKISKQIESLLSGLTKYIDPKLRNRTDTRWYYVAPMLFDKGTDSINEYFEQDKPEEKMHKASLLEFYSYYKDSDSLKLGRMPKDLVEVLTNMALASPAVCALRIFSDTILASRFAKEMINIFNTPEAISSIELVYGKSNDDAYYKNVLKYSVDGNIQAVLDEYVHMLNEQQPDRLCEKMCDAISLNTASYPIDTYLSFKNEIEGKREKKISIRSHFAAGFYNTSGDKKTSQRKESLRNTFNSPFRPFVLATTSIGQEGLDFHYYCRKIIHWNLPSNPIDLEQREGRINRYKCLAIRQNIARKYGTLPFKKDIWNEMFEAALIKEKGNRPELVPFWCLPGGSDIKIERIVPMYPLSKDGAAYQRLIKILSLYRLTLGQARQEELVEYLLNNIEDTKVLEDVFINLSPFIKENNNE